MAEVSALGPRLGRSESGPRHCTRQDVCRFHLDRALAETPLKLEDFAEALGYAYDQLVVGHARRLRFERLSVELPHKEFAKRLGAMVKLVQTYLDPSGHMHFPAELEEAWVMALPSPYDRACRDELVRRHGCLGVDKRSVVGVTPADDFRGLAEVMAAASEVSQRYSALLADGRLDQDDALEAIRAREVCRNAAALLIGLDMHIARKTGLEDVE